MQEQEFLDFFNPFLEDKEENKCVIISKYDSEGNLACFLCRKQGNRFPCSGHICLCNHDGSNSSITLPMLFNWMKLMEQSGVNIIVDLDWFLQT